MQAGTKGRIFVSIVIMALVAALVVSGTQLLTQIELTKRARQATEQANEAKALAETAQRNMELKYNKLERECDLLEQQCSGIQNLHEVQEEALYTYIRGKFIRIPKVVAREIAVQTVRLTAEHGAPFSVVVALMQVESSFRPSAVSKTGALGLMQVMPDIWVDELDFLMEQRDLHEIDLGIKAGICIYLGYYEETGSISEALAKYLGASSDEYKSKVFNAMGEFTLHMAERK